MKFQLEIQKIERTCLFKLKWNREKQISTIVSYPDALSELYQAWRKAYLNFYQTALRARVRKAKNGGKINLPQDRHRQLVQAEAQLLEVFHRWLRNEELYEIRAKIAIEGGKDKTAIGRAANPLGLLFLTCSRELERLPWETWELGAEFDRSVQIARSPTNITNSNQKTLKPSSKPRILAILGDDTGLDLNSDRTAINTLKQIAEVELVTWNSQQSITEIKQQIQQALTDAKGWEVLFFAGHSNETAITGGEIAIAPNIALSVTEIADELRTAQGNGLQFALFNSCSGLSIANSLIDLGLSQVAVMREPVHNKVAQVFLVRFLEALVNYQNVQQALISAGKHLRQQNLTYPSAYLIPSLFCHPEAQLYRIQPWGWQQQLKQWLPSRREAIAASALCLLSIMPPVQNYLLDKRTLVQSIYRDVTGQLPTTTEAPVTLIHIDEQSLRRAEIDRPVPMDRQYLASLVDRLVATEAQVIGTDYLFDRPQPQNDPILARSIKDAVAQHQTWFVFGAYKQIDEREIGVTPETNIGSPNWTLQGYTDGLPNYMTLLPKSINCQRVCPFSYLLATVQQVNRDTALQPNINSQTDLRDSIYSYVDRQQKDRFIQQAKLPSSITLVHQYLKQQWLRPILDFSIPTDLVYDRIPAWQLFELKNTEFKTQTVIIGSGGYPGAGLNIDSDNLSTPTAIAYWNTRRGLNRGETPFTGSEVLAYMTSHWLSRRLVVPIPELWAVLTALLIAKGIKLSLRDKTFTAKWLLILLSSAATAYGLIALQLYISNAILLPWLLPSVAVVTYLSKPPIVTDY